MLYASYNMFEDHASLASVDNFQASRRLRANLPGSSLENMVYSRLH